MKAIVSRAYGPPDQVLRVEDVDIPVAGDDDVVVRTRASSVNPADWHLVRGEPRIARAQLGLRRPKHHVLGCDVSGEVDAVGAGVTDLRPGDEVFGSPFMRGFGAFAEYVRVPRDCLAAKPANLSHEQAAAVPLAALTALQGLRDHGHLHGRAARADHRRLGRGRHLRRADRPVLRRRGDRRVQRPERRPRPVAGRRPRRRLHERGRHPFLRALRPRAPGRRGPRRRRRSAGC